MVDRISQRMEKKKESGKIPRMSETLDFSVCSESRGAAGGWFEGKIDSKSRFLVQKRRN